MIIKGKQRCSNCGQVKTVHHFHKLAAQDGYQKYCMSCAREYNKSWRARKRAQKKAKETLTWKAA